MVTQTKERQRKEKFYAKELKVLVEKYNNYSVKYCKIIMSLLAHMELYCGQGAVNAVGQHCCNMTEQLSLGKTGTLMDILQLV